MRTSLSPLRSYFTRRSRVFSVTSCRALSGFFSVESQIFLESRTPFCSSIPHSLSYKHMQRHFTDTALMFESIPHCVNSETSFPYHLGRSPTEATRLRFDQEKNRLHLIHGESTSHRDRAGERSVITNWRFDQYATVKWFFLDRIVVASPQWETGLTWNERKVKGTLLKPIGMYSYSLRQTLLQTRTDYCLTPVDVTFCTGINATIQSHLTETFWGSF
jgi:hypothetical protein